MSRFVTGAGLAASLACGIAVFVAAPTLLKLLYGPEFVKYAPCARLFAVSVVLSAFAVGPIITLTATRRVRPLFMLQLAKLAFAVAAVSVVGRSLRGHRRRGGVRVDGRPHLSRDHVACSPGLADREGAQRSIRRGGCPETGW